MCISFSVNKSFRIMHRRNISYSNNNAVISEKVFREFFNFKIRQISKLTKLLASNPYANFSLTQHLMPRTSVSMQAHHPIHNGHF